MHSGEREFAENRLITAWPRFAAARMSAEQLLKQDPRNRLGQGQLAAVYLRLGALEYESNRWSEANELFDKGLAIAKQRTAADSSDLEAQRALLDVYGNAVAFRLRISHYGEAAYVFQEGDQLARTLVAASDTDEAAQRDLADWYERVGQEFQRWRRAKPDSYRASVAIRTKLATAHPQDIQAQRDLAAAYENLGSVAIGASLFFLKSLEIRKRLAAGAPQEPEFQHDLAVVYEKMATQAARDLDRIPLGQRAAFIQRVREFYGHDLEIAKRLAANRSADGAAQHDLAVCYGELADFSRQTRRSDEACNYYEQQLEILAKLAAAEPTNSEVQNELAVAYDVLGDLSWQLEQVDRARDSFQRAFDLHARLAAANPGDWVSLSHLDQSCAKFARVAHWRGDLDAAEKISRRGIALMTKLCDTPAGREYLKSGVAYAMNDELRQCERTRVVSGPLDALLKKPAREVPSLLSDRIRRLAAQRDVDGVAKAAETLAQFEPKDQWNLFSAARGYALSREAGVGLARPGAVPCKGRHGKECRRREGARPDRQGAIRAGRHRASPGRREGRLQKHFLRSKRSRLCRPK